MILRSMYYFKINGIRITAKEKSFIYKATKSQTLECMTSYLKMKCWSQKHQKKFFQKYPAFRNIRRRFTEEIVHGRRLLLT